MKKRSPKAEPLGISPYPARWKRRSPENASVEVIEVDVETFTSQTHETTRPTRSTTGKRRLLYRVLTFQDLAVLHLALTRQYQRTSVDSIADDYDNLLGKLEDILESRPDTIRFR